MRHRTELSFVDEFRWFSPLHYLKNGWQNAVLRWCMLQAGPPSLHYYCAVVLHSCILLPHVGHSLNHEYHCCQLTRQSSCVSNFCRTFKVFIWLSLVNPNWCSPSTFSNFLSILLLSILEGWLCDGRRIAWLWLLFCNHSAKPLGHCPGSYMFW